jgi:hypothetical protein
VPEPTPEGSLPHQPQPESATHAPQFLYHSHPAAKQRGSQVSRCRQTPAQQKAGARRVSSAPCTPTMMAAINTKTAPRILLFRDEQTLRKGRRSVASARKSRAARQPPTARGGPKRFDMTCTPLTVGFRHSPGPSLRTSRLAVVKNCFASTHDGSKHSTRQVARQKGEARWPGRRALPILGDLAPLLFRATPLQNRKFPLVA